ncbi:MAG: PEP-CTERM sorting domain-containing protein [Microcystis panniformis Mp_MB_F_20051200_S9]|uniref:PEP-CTERM sorting domain-containing protein n=1 Tax=Microcystis panniformis Mp_MB_F_20051200_S9 TaxID=2486223 RepID=A0A552PJ99_9CHRO|nr:MAG: PEP-CTERM sorting domain-containing protein [Microcystis panniformis Mp_MB_F_20080800_S26D]TRV46810.1 MAG: PEP-CTERM sorting domain-containing protein [Microcystis panniformis Mp_GB_SS_20050300_S99D]TRV51688.1 MAG: PEP-CTERM sorting domain-containing protein [Microcystis panniformis Mp_GB_SS_20050300_S99]TRV57054.1 MAG: PEP-CTERM sorting domain-containing protein [Microcystis panniformis Mp_MB_F_20051200_S9]TRV57793.1 MAG: PEP-CTERM sorting domain-containing protein [Microcystis pannifo
MTQKILAKLMSFAGSNKLGLFKIAIASSFLVIVPQGQVKAALLTINNSSFEGPTAPLQSTPTFGYYTINDITNWSLSPTPSIQGVLDPGLSEPLNPGNQFYGLPANLPLGAGNQIAWSNGGTISQTLSATLQANTRYTLGAFVGRRFSAIFAGYTIRLLAGNTLLSSISNTDSGPTPAQGTFAPVSFTYTSGDIVTPGQQLTIELFTPSVTAGQTNFDLITLDAASTIPEPSAILGLLGFGLLGIASKLRQKQ